MIGIDFRVLEVFERYFELEQCVKKNAEHCENYPDELNRIILTLIDVGQFGSQLIMSRSDSTFWNKSCENKPGSCQGDP
jgi:hypothetical protein